MTDEERWQGIAIYALYLIALLTGVPFFIGVILAYLFKSSGSPEIVTHFEHQIGLFWRFFLGNVVIAVLVGFGWFLTATVVLAVIGVPLLLLCGAAFIWLWLMMLTRCVRGLGRVGERQAYPIPGGWGL